MIAIGKDLRLERKECAAGVDEIHAGKPVLQRHFLRAHVLLDGDWIVGPSLHGRIVRDDQHLAPGHAADAGDDARRRRIVVVQVPRGEWRELEQRRSWIEQLVDALAYRKLSLLAMPLQVALASALPRDRDALPQLAHERAHAIAVALKVVARGIDVRLETIHVNAGGGPVNLCQCQLANAKRPTFQGTRGRLAFVVVPFHHSAFSIDKRHIASPAAAVGLEPARGAPPDGMHAKHLRAATLAKDFVGRARRVGPIRRRRRRRGVGRFRHPKNYIPGPEKPPDREFQCFWRMNFEQMSADGQFCPNVYTL